MQPKATSAQLATYWHILHVLYRLGCACRQCIVLRDDGNIAWAFRITPVEDLAKDRVPLVGQIPFEVVRS